LEELRSVQEGLYSSFPHYSVLLSHAIIQKYSSATCHHSGQSFRPSSFRTITPSHIIHNYSSVPLHHSELFFRPTLSFRTILPPHVIIQNYSSAPRRYAELFLHSTSSFVSTLPSHINKNYSCVQRHHPGTILPSDLIMRSYCSVRKDNIFPTRTHAHTQKNSKIN
jgi:hypothetical protein